MDDIKDLLHGTDVATAPQIAEFTGQTVKAVRHAIQRLGIVPKYIMGERQFAVEDVLAVVLLVRLLKEFGDSPLPYQIMRHARPALANLAKAPSHGTVIVHQSGGPLRVAISVPSVRELLTATTEVTA
jgi:hypothetical protein